jgi:hypothetical protein
MTPASPFTNVVSQFFPRIYFLGIKWLYKRKSHFMLKAGPAEDAAYIAEHIKTRGKPN